MTDLVWRRGGHLQGLGHRYRLEKIGKCNEVERKWSDWWRWGHGNHRLESMRRPVQPSMMICAGNRLHGQLQKSGFDRASVIHRSPVPESCFHPLLSRINYRKYSADERFFPVYSWIWVIYRWITEAMEWVQISGVNEGKPRPWQTLLAKFCPVLILFVLFFCTGFGSCFHSRCVSDRLSRSAVKVSVRHWFCVRCPSPGGSNPIVEILDQVRWKKIPHPSELFVEIR